MNMWWERTTWSNGWQLFSLMISHILFIYLYLIFCKFVVSEVTLSLRLLHYKNRNGLTYENRPCDTRSEYDINHDGRCDTAFLFCLVRLPFQNTHNCTLGYHFTGFVGADDIQFINIDEQQQQQQQQEKFDVQQRSSSLISLWFQPTIYFRFQYPKVLLRLLIFDGNQIFFSCRQESV